MKLYPKTASEWQDCLFVAVAFPLVLFAVGYCVLIWRDWYSSLPFLPHTGWRLVEVSLAIALGLLCIVLLILSHGRARTGFVILLFWALASSSAPLVTECADVCWRLAYVRSEIAAQRNEWMNSAHEESVVTVSDQKDMPIFSVYYRGGMGSQFKGGLIMALWPDGTLIYPQSDPLHGGPPFLKAKLDPSAVRATMDRIRATGVFSDPWYNVGQEAVDAPSRTLCARDGERCVVMTSSLEYGMLALYSDFRYLEWIEDFSNYLHVWDQLDTVMYQLRLKEGVSVEVNPVFKKVAVR